MILFASDDDLRLAQQKVTRLKKGESISAETERREWVDDMREMRAHARAREFAWLLFVLPVLMAIAVALAQFIVTRILS